MNMSKKKLVMGNDTPIYVNNTQIENIESYAYLGQRYSTRDKNHPRRFKGESRPDGQHSPSTATYSRVALKHNIRNETSVKLMRTSSNDIRRGNMGTHHPSKDRGSSYANKDGKVSVKHHIPGQKHNIWIREKTKVTDVIEQVTRRK